MKDRRGLKRLYKSNKGWMVAGVVAAALAGGAFVAPQTFGGQVNVVQAATSSVPEYQFVDIDTLEEALQNDDASAGLYFIEHYLGLTDPRAAAEEYGNTHKVVPGHVKGDLSKSNLALLSYLIINKVQQGGLKDQAYSKLFDQLDAAFEAVDESYDAGYDDAMQGKEPADVSGLPERNRNAYNEGYKNATDKRNADIEAGTNAGKEDGAAGKESADLSDKSKDYTDAYNDAYKEAKAATDKEKARAKAAADAKAAIEKLTPAVQAAADKSNARKQAAADAKAAIEKLTPAVKAAADKSNARKQAAADAKAAIDELIPAVKAAADKSNARKAAEAKTIATVATPATKAAVTTTVAKTTKAAAATKALPQTGDDVNVAASAMGVVAVLGALFGLAGTSLKKRA